LLGPWFKYNTLIADVDISATNLRKTQNSNSNLSEFSMLEQFLSEGPAVYDTSYIPILKTPKVRKGSGQRARVEAGKGLAWNKRDDGN
jgi:hypothetical protein